MQNLYWQTAECLANDYQRSAMLLAERISVLQKYVGPHHARVALLRKEQREMLKMAQRIGSTYRFFY